MTETQSQDQTRLGLAEANISVLQSDAQATVNLLAGITSKLDKLTAAQYPPFHEVMRTFSAGVVTASILLGGFFYLTNAQIDNKTAQLHERLARVEAAIAWQPSFVTIAKQ